MYPAELTQPMREQLTTNGFADLTTADAVDSLINQSGTTLVVVNSVCGCAAGAARPGVLMAIKNTQKLPSRMGTVFAGVDQAATQQARTHLLPFPPSSPSIALFKDGNLVHFIERRHIEGRPAQLIAENLIGAFDQFC